MSTSAPEPGPQVPLPELSPQRIDEIETALFADIAAERTRQTSRGRRRRGMWIASGAAAVVVAVAAVIAPSVGSLVNGPGGGTADEAAVAPAAPDGSEAFTQDDSGAAGSDARDAALQAEQAAAWNPLLAWAGARYGIEFALT